MSSLSSRRGARAATELASESLVGSFLGDSGHWVFVGEAGSTYWSKSPLGDFEKKFSPDEFMLRTVVANHQIVGIGPAQRLWTSEDAGQNWRREGSTSTRFVDIWSRGPLTLALASPEALWSRTHPGKAFSPVGWKPIGAFGFLENDATQPVVTTVFGPRSLSSADGSTWTVSSAKTPPSDKHWQLPARPQLGPSAYALNSGTAQLFDNLYQELVLGPSPRLLQGQWDEALQSRAVPVAGSCARGRLASFGQHLLLACTKSSPPTAPMDFYASGDEGLSFRRIDTLAGDFAQLLMAVDAAGNWLVSGVCAPQTTSLPCQPRGVWFGQSKASRPVQWRRLAFPGLEGALLGLHVGQDGHRVCAIGRTSKNEWLYSFVARSSNELFRPSRLPLAYAGATSVDSLQETPDGGYAAVVRQKDSGTQILRFTQTANGASLFAPPVDDASIGLAGHRALAQAGKALWQSDDYGEHWARIATPHSARCSEPSPTCRLPVHCHQQGCVLGEQATRIGWTGPTAAQRLAQPTRPPPDADSSDEASAPALQCRPSSPFQRLSNVRTLPSASEASLGQTEVFALSCERETASCGVWQFARATPQRPVFVRLLPSPKHSGPYALAGRLQVEGAAAMRFATTGNDRLLEVGWLDLLHETSGLRSMQLPKAADEDDYERIAGMDHRTIPSLLSIARGGAFVRPYPKSQAGQATWYLPTTGPAERLHIPRWPAPLSRYPFEVVRVGSRLVPIGLHQATHTVLRGSPVGSPLRVDAQFLGMPRFPSKTRSHWSLGYDNSHRIGIAETQFFEDGSTSSHWYAIQDTGNPLSSPRAQPSQQALAAAPLPCSSEQRANTPRVLAPPSPSSRREVLLPDLDQRPSSWRTEQAVLFGTAEHPCLAAYEATPTTPNRRHLERAIVRPTGTSWQFRRLPNTLAGKPQIEFRTLVCQWETTRTSANLAWESKSAKTL